MVRVDGTSVSQLHFTFAHGSTESTHRFSPPRAAITNHTGIHSPHRNTDANRCRTWFTGRQVTTTAEYGNTDSIRPRVRTTSADRWFWNRSLRSASDTGTVESEGSGTGTLSDEDT